jgi:diguanylate cyclase (GGDEF)-like protein
MMSGQFTGAWATHQLAEFLSAVSGASDEAGALSLGTERAATAFEAEVAAILRDGRVLGSIGLANPALHTTELLTAAGAGAQMLDVPGVGLCVVATYDHDGTARLLVARHADEPFTAEEHGLLRSMSRALGLTLKNFRLLDSLRERQELLTRLATIQRSISHRAELDEIFDAITAGLAELFGDEIAMIRLVDPDDPVRQVLASSHGLPVHVADAVRIVPVADDTDENATCEGRLLVIGDYPSDEHAVPEFVEWGVTTMAAAPVHESGRIVGAIQVGSRDPNRRYTADELEALVAFAEHASIALTDAQALAGMRRSLHDPLTNLPNRTLFLDRLQTALTDAEVRHRLTVLFVDLDRFKAVNDNLGHSAGDEVLITVAERLTVCIRPTDLVARLGGDEFTILLENTGSEDEAVTVAERIQLALNEPIAVAGREIVIGASIGIASHDTTGLTGSDLINAADVAMYHVKSTGRGRCERFVPALGERARRLLDIETALRSALDNDELVLHYQPLVDLRNHENIPALEALLRFRGPGLADLPVAETIAVAEDTGLIHRVGAWAIDEACRQLTAWRALGIGADELPVVHVNLSGHQLRDPELVRTVTAALADHGLEANLLTLEITESVLIGNDTPSLDALRRLHELGLRMSLDDFGKGYSSLAYLAELDIDSLKIDQRLVQRLGHRRGDVVVQHLIAMAQQLGMRVVGEGVETDEQRCRLRDFGCDLAQGLLFAPALPAVAVTSLITGGRLSEATAAVSSTV